jgi:hypothetical protein
VLNSWWSIGRLIHLPPRQGQSAAPLGETVGSAQRLSFAGDYFLLQDTASDDEERSSRDSYESLKTVTPVFNAELAAEIEALIDRYERETGQPIPSALRWKSADYPPENWRTNKSQRLKAVLWVMNHLSAAGTAAEAINQLAGVLDRVESRAHLSSIHHSAAEGALPDPRPMRLPEPLPEVCEGQPILAAFGIRHVILFNADGAVQVQCLPESSGMVHYRRRAQRQEWVLLDKRGTNGRDFWTTSG